MKRYLLLVALCLAALSCTQEAELSITPDVGAFQFDETGGQFDAIILTNGSWTASCDDPAVSFSPQSGDYSSPIHVTVGANEEMYTKVIRITLNAKLDNLTRTSRIVVTQTCAPFLFCEEATKTIGPEGGLIHFSVNSNEPWSVAQPDAISGSQVTPLTGGPNSTIVTFDIPANGEGRERTFVAQLNLQDHPSVSLTLTVVQRY